MAKTQPVERRINIDIGELRDPLKKRLRRLGLTMKQGIPYAIRFFLANGRKR